MEWVVPSSARPWTLPGAVIPAKAGIHFARRWNCAAEGLDSRFRGNDFYFDTEPGSKRHEHGTSAFH